MPNNYPVQENPDLNRSEMNSYIPQGTHRISSK